VQLDRKVLAFGQLPSSKGDLYVPASGRKGYAHNLTLHNTNTTSEDVVLNYHDGTNEHEILSETIPAGDSLYLEFPGEGEVVGIGGKFTGNTTTASKVTFKFSGTEEIPDPVVGGDGAESNLWAHPAIAHVQDDEFEEDTFTGWSVQNLTTPAVGSISANTVDPYDTTFTSGNAVRANTHNNGRRSWALFQPPASGDEFAVYKAYTLPTNLLMVSRPMFAQKTAGQGGVAGDCNFGIALFTASGGVPTDASRVVLHINVTQTGVYRAESSYYSTGGTRSDIHTATDVDTQGQAIRYLAIHKVGTTFHTWCGTDSNWIWMTAHTSVGFTPDMVGFVLKQVSSSNIVNPCGADFIRFQETDKFLL